MKHRKLDNDAGPNGSFVSFGGTKKEDFKDVICKEVSSNDIEYDRVDLDVFDQPFELRKSKVELDDASPWLLLLFDTPAMSLILNDTPPYIVTNAL